MVEGDRDLCYQMIANLLSNAVKYSPKDSEINLTLSETNGKKIFTISDTGYGMTEETQKMIFERFYKSNVYEDNTTSSGLGMSIVKVILDAHVFNIDINSTVGEGTKISIEL